MKVKINEVFKAVVTNVYDVNLEKYKEWLNGKESNDDNLIDYIGESMNEPLDYWDDDEFMSSYVYDDNNLHNIINNNNDSTNRRRI